MKIKLIVGFRRDQEHSVDIDEAHKAYYLFLHPNERGVFSNGLAMIGSHIQEIVPDYHGTMGWNNSHLLDDDDWNEIRKKGIDTRLRDLMYEAKQIASQEDKTLISKPLSQILVS